MGFSIMYRSTRPVSTAEAASIKEAAEAACRGRTWLSCEPVHFNSGSEDGHLLGSSKSNFHPHPDDVASAKNEGLPDGTLRDLLDILCQLSRDHGIDWEVHHDHSDGPIGLIQAGECEGDVVAQVEAFADVAEFLGGLSDEEFMGPE